MAVTSEQRREEQAAVSMEKVAAQGNYRLSVDRNLGGEDTRRAAIRLTAWLVIVAAYFITGKIGLHYAVVSRSATPLWAPAGIALAGCLLLGYWIWPAIMVGAFLVNITTSGSIPAALAIAVGNTLEALAGAWLVNRFANGVDAFERPRDAFAFFVLAGALSTMIAAIVGVAALCLDGDDRWAQFLPISITWWLGDGSGDVLVAPLLILWARHPRLKWTVREACEAILLLLSVIGVGGIVFGGWLPLASAQYPLDYACFSVLLWAAFRFGVRETATASVILAVVAAAGTLNGLGPFAQLSPNESLLLLQTFTGTSAMMSILVAIVVAERRRLDESRALLAAIVDSSDDAIVGETLDGTITSWNESAARIFGMSAAEAIGRPINTIIPPEKRSESDEVAAKIRAGEPVRNFQTVRLRKDGHRVHISLTLSPVRDRHGNMIAASRIARDITEEKMVEQEREALLESEQAAHAAADKALSMLRRLQMVSDSALSQVTREELMPALLNCTRAALDSDAAAILLADADGEYLMPASSIGLREELRQDPQVRIPLGQGVAGRIAVSEQGLIFDDLSTADAMTPFLRIQLSSLVGAPMRAEGRIIGVIYAGSKAPRIFTADDLNLIRLVAERAASAIERTRWHDEQRAAREAAEQANRAKDEFLAMLGHELRNPLHAISLAVRLLDLEDQVGRMPANARAIISRQAQHLTRLVDDLLDIGRLTSGRILLVRRPVDLGECVTQCVRDLRETRQLQDHEIRVQAESAWVNGDSDRLTQIVSNLLGNAIKYTPAGGHIEVSVTPNGGCAELRVKDEGVGIQPELLPRLFDMFARGAVGLDRSPGGLGIGLTLVKRLTELHDGEAEAYSDGPGTGSTFIMRFPLIEKPDTRLEAGVVQEDAESALRILIIEDNHDARESMRAILEIHHHQVDEAEDGPGGVAAALTIRPDVALIDIGLPKLDGYEVARRIRAENSTMVLIALTGYAENDYRKNAASAAFNAYVAKPVEIPQLLQLLQRLSPKRSASSVSA